MKQLSSSIGIGSSHIHTIPPFPRVRDALSIKVYFFTSRLSGLEDLVQKAGGIVHKKAFVLAEGDAQYRKDVIFLATIPIL